jgi:hypothetical protein
MRDQKRVNRGETLSEPFSPFEFETLRTPMETIENFHI